MRLLPFVSLSLLFGSLAACTGGERAASDPLSFVDPFIGTQVDHGQLYPGPTVPFGLAKPGPDTDGRAHSGYDYAATHLHGFSHLRLGGVGCAGTGGNVLLKPGLGGIVRDRDAYREAMRKDTEVATPGYYAVTLASGIRAEVTTTPRVGLHRYTFPPDADSAFVLLDLGRSYARLLNARFEVQADGEITGTVAAMNVCDRGRYSIHFALALDADVADWTGWAGDDMTPQLASGRGDAVGLGLRLPPGTDTVHVKVGFSPISAAQARRDRDAEVPGWDFDGAHAQARAAWADALGRIAVRGGTEAQRRLFYTMLYRSHLLPHDVSSTDGTFVAPHDSATVRRLADLPALTRTPDMGGYYSGWSLWDDIRKYQLLALTQPARVEAFARSLADWYATRPRPMLWSDGWWPSPSVRMEFGGALPLDAYQRGLTGFDAEAVLAGVVADAETYPTSSVSAALESTFTGYLAMRLAEELGRPALADSLRPRALGYAALWNADQADNQGHRRGFFTPAGEHVDDVEVFNRFGYEGSLWHYRWFVPHDLAGLATLRSSTPEAGQEALLEDLVYYFEQDLHMALNEPAFQAPYLFSYLGRPDLTQRWARTFTTDTVVQRYHNHGPFDAPVVRPVFQATPEGLLPTMDEDTGAMASWYVFSALGLFPGTPGEPTYVIGSPLFDEATLDLGDGATFTIRAEGTSDTNRYVQRATLNGEPYDRPWIDYATMARGGTLALTMGPAPNPAWGSAPASAPPSFSDRLRSPRGRTPQSFR